MVSRCCVIVGVLIGLIGAQGCTTTHHAQDIVVESALVERNTPFVFKDYQTRTLYVTQDYVETKSDFVDVEVTDQFVFASTPNPDSIFTQLTPMGQSPNESSNALLPAQLDELVSEHTVLNPSVMPLGIQASSCLPIICPGGDTCGEIKVCDGQPCDETQHTKYRCGDSHCEITGSELVNCLYTPDAMGSGQCNLGKDEHQLCGQYPELDACPSRVTCTSTLTITQ